MPVPAFGWNGLIPPFLGSGPAGGVQSPYFASMVELATVLGTSDQRRQLVRNLAVYRQMLTAAGYVSGFQLVNGSFVENVEVLRGRPPADIDVMSFLNKPEKFADDLAAWVTVGIPFWEAEIVNVAKNKARFLLDTYALLMEDALAEDFMYWHGLFSHHRMTYNWKGYLRIPLDPRDDANALHQLGGP